MQNINNCNVCLFLSTFNKIKFCIEEKRKNGILLVTKISLSRCNKNGINKYLGLIIHC